MSKLALVISSMSLGGASRVMSLLANHWAARGTEVVLITLDLAAHDAWTLDDRIERVALHMMSNSANLIQGTVNGWRRMRAVRRAIAVSRADAVVSFEDRTNVLVRIATLGMRARVVLCERTDPTKHRIDAVWRLLRRLTYPLADALVVQANALAGWGAAVMLGKARVHVVPNPLRDMESFVSRSRERPLTIAAVGRLVPEKAYDILVEAFADLADEFPGWRLVIAGDGPEMRRLAALVQARAIADRVRLAGWVGEPGEVLAAASLFVMSSRYEGFPNALLEAMACGLAVISTAYAGSVELISDGVDGLLVQVDSRAELAQAMRRVMKDGQLRAELARNAPVAARRYALDSVIKKWDALTEQPR